MFNVILLAGAAYAVHKGRKYLLKKPIQSDVVESFNGDLFQFGPSIIAKRAPISTNAPKKTVICFPGFMETMQYFTELYAEQDVELILINNAGYHNPFGHNDIQTLEWEETIPYKIGTIAYDASLVNLVVAKLVTTDHVIVHGHSRGGAIMLEAAKQNPTAFKKIDAILEAPVLPQTKPAGKVEVIAYNGGFYTLPFLFHLVLKLPKKYYLKTPLMKISTPRKRNLFLDMYRNPGNTDLILTNINNILDWQRVNTYDLYQNLKSVNIVIGQKDGVLSRWYMKQSAAKAEEINAGSKSSKTRVLMTEGTDHFISVERPEIMHDLLKTIAADHKPAKKDNLVAVK